MAAAQAKNAALTLTSMSRSKSSSLNDSTGPSRHTPAVFTSASMRPVRASTWFAGSGLDIDLATALASDLRVKLRFVDSSFVTLVQDLQAGTCDVAMFGIAMLPQRMEQLQFSTPYLQSDIYAVTTRTSRIVRQWSDIDQPGVQVGVQAGTFMEPVMRQRLKHAGLVSIHLPQTRERELIAGRVDVFMTDYPYGRALIESTEWAALVAPPKPFYTLPYAHASKPGDVEWRAVLNAFVARIRQDGRLETAARRHGLESILLN
mgnify:CR=1 FL=1